MTRRLYVLVAGALLTSAAFVPAYAAPSAAKSSAVAAMPVTAGDLIAVAEAAGDFNTFISLVKTAGLTDTLKEPGPYTVFAPTDKAWARLPQARLRTLQRPENKNDLAQILLYHMMPGEVTSAGFSGTQIVTSVEGNEITIRASMDEVSIGDAKLVKPDIRASNGIIHGIDAVLEIPEYPATPIATK